MKRVGSVGDSVTVGVARLAAAFQAVQSVRAVRACGVLLASEMQVPAHVVLTHRDLRLNSLSNSATLP